MRHFLVAAVATKYKHKIYIWNRYGGQLVKFLEGEREGVVDLAVSSLAPPSSSVLSHTHGREITCISCINALPLLLLNLMFAFL